MCSLRRSLASRSVPMLPGPTMAARVFVPVFELPVFELPVFELPVFELPVFELPVFEL
jgi:hypothetical protein